MEWAILSRRLDAYASKKMACAGCFQCAIIVRFCYAEKNQRQKLKKEGTLPVLEQVDACRIRLLIVMFSVCLAAK